MHELGIGSFGLQMVLNGDKTVELCLGKPEFLKLRKGDALLLREQTKQNGQSASPAPGTTHVRITQLLYFETLEEVFSALNYAAIVPTADDPDDVLALYKQLYPAQEVEEYGVIAITFKLG
jgi:ASC-1-like (ASCH) protein